MAARRKGCYCCKPHKSLGNAKPEHRMTASTRRRLEAADWVDEDAPPNGIGPVCRGCGRLIDWHPVDHALDCPLVGDGRGL